MNPETRQHLSTPEAAGGPVGRANAENLTGKRAAHAYRRDTEMWRSGIGGTRFGAMRQAVIAGSSRSVRENPVSSVIDGQLAREAPKPIPLA